MPAPAARRGPSGFAIRRVLPIVARASIAACASAAQSSGKRWPMTGCSVPLAARSSARRVSSALWAGAIGPKLSRVMPDPPAAGISANRRWPCRSRRSGPTEQQAEGVPPGLAADTVEDDVDRPGIAAHRLRPARLTVVDGQVRAQFPGGGELARPARQRDHAGSGALGQLHQQAPDAARGRLNKDGLPGSEASGAG